MTSTWDAGSWPADIRRRIAVRLLLAAPLVALSVWAAAAYTSPEHADLIARGEVLTTADSVTVALDAAHPPAPVAFAAVLGSALALSVVASLFTGSALHAVVQRMVQRRIPWLLIVALVVGVMAPPSAWYVATQELSTIAGLALLVLALDGYVRFAFAEETDGGFTAGLLVAAAYLFDPAALAYAVVLAAAAPLLAWVRHRGERGAARATFAVIAFPTVALVAATGYLQWMFTGDVVPASLRSLGVFAFPEGVAGAAGDALSELGWVLAHSPVYVVVGVLLLLRRPIAGVGFGLPLLGLGLTLFAGFTYPRAASVLLLAFLAMAAAPYRPTRPVIGLLAAAAVAQLVLNIGVEIPGWSALFA